MAAVLPTAEAEGGKQSAVRGDVEKLASHFKERYGSLVKALKDIGEDVEFNLCDFEAALKKWGVKVDDVVELFAHIDVDWNGTVSVGELFSVLELPVQELEEREATRHKHEVRLIYEELARSLRGQYGSVAAYFAKVVPEGSSADLSVAKFSKFARDLGLELEAIQVNRVFSEIDKDGSGSVSMQELQRALNKYLLQSILEEMAGLLMERHGSVGKAFQLLDAFRRQTSPRVPAASLLPLPLIGEGSPVAASPSAATPASSAGKPEEHLTEAYVLRILRELTQAPIDPLARQLHALLHPVSLEGLVQRLSEAEKGCREAKKKVATERRRERDQQRRASKGFNSRARAEARVQAWMDSRTREMLEEHSALASTPAALGAAAAAGLLGSEADLRQSPGIAALPGGFVEDATRAWSAVARAGRSTAQLHDYISDFESRLGQEEDNLEQLRARLRKGQDEADGLHEFFADAGGSPRSPSSPAPFYMTPGSRPAATPKASARGRLGVPPLSQEAKVAQIDRLIQAAAVGDVAGVQRLSAMQVSVDAVAWGGTTPLMAAARHGRIAVLECLIARQADLRLTDMHGRTALDYARGATREWLRSVGAQTGKELAAEAEALARRVLLAKAEEVRLKGLIDELPSEEVLRQARLRRHVVTPLPPRGGESATPTWRFCNPTSPERSPYDMSSCGASPQLTSCLSAQRPGRAGDVGARGFRSAKQVNIMLPGEAFELGRSQMFGTALYR